MLVTMRASEEKRIVKTLRITGITLLGFIVLIWVVAQIALLGSSGGLIDFFQGQMSPEVEIMSGRATATEPPVQVQASVDTNTIVHETSAEYLSFALDTSQIVGGKWWDPEADDVEIGSGDVHAPIFEFRPKFENLVKALTPAVLRIGGSEADKVYYDMRAEPGERPEPPQGYESVLTPEMFDNVVEFADRVPGLRLQFTLNAGPSARDKDGAWDSENAITLLDYAKRNNRNVDIWELGNELNLYWFMYGLSKVVSTEQYAKDVHEARAAVKERFPQTPFSGQGSAFWPVFGEPLQVMYGFQEDYLVRSGKDTDIVSWHYYPQQSRRGPIHSRKAAPGRLLNPDNLDEVAHWGREVMEWRDEFAPGKPIWLGETGNAQFGGEPGVSDAYIGGLWWLDQLGLLATLKHDVIVRQTITGMNYGMLEAKTLDPLPDYWNSLLWKRLMGQRVLSVSKANQTESEGASDETEESRKVRLYAHCSKDGGGGITMLAINLNHDRKAIVQIPQFSDQMQQFYAVTTRDVLGQSLTINGKEPKVGNEGIPDRILPVETKPEKAGMELEPLGYGFLVLPEAGAKACP